VLQTERLVLRRWRDDDIAAMERLNTDPRFTTFLTADGRPFTAAESAAAVARWRRHWDEHGFGLWAVEERETGRFVGRVGVQYHRLWPDDPEVGWGIDPELWGSGYATEAGAAAIEDAFATLDIPRLVSIVLPANTASIAVQTRLGIRPWETVRWPEGDADLEVRVLERSDWARLQSPA
jgi:RimJ/RimL family protein N-acetyltransferase